MWEVSNYIGSTTTAFTAHRIERYRTLNLKALKKTGSQSVEATIRQRRLLFAGALARQGDKRLPKRLLFAERLEGGERPGTRPAGTALAEKLEGRLQGIRSSTRLHAQLIGGLSESTGSSGKRRRARGRECRAGTQGSCWGRRDLWRRGTRAKKRLASYAR